MSARAITLHLPAPLFEKLARRATEAHRTVEDELLEVVSVAVPDEDDPDPEVSALSVLDDAALWQAARTRLPEPEAARLEELHWKRQQGSLSGIEEQERSRLVQQYERALLVRAQAAKLLHEKGHDVSSLLANG